MHLVLGRGRLRKCACRFLISIPILYIIQQQQLCCVALWTYVRTLEEVQQPARGRVPRKAILVLQILQ